MIPISQKLNEASSAGMLLGYLMACSPPSAALAIRSKTALRRTPATSSSPGYSKTFSRIECSETRRIANYLVLPPNPLALLLGRRSTSLLFVSVKGCRGKGSLWRCCTSYPPRCTKPSSTESSPPVSSLFAHFSSLERCRALMATAPGSTTRFLLSSKK